MHEMHACVPRYTRTRIAYTVRSAKPYTIRDDLTANAKVILFFSTGDAIQDPYHVEG